MDDADGETDDRRNADGHDVPTQTHLLTPAQIPSHRWKQQGKNLCKAAHGRYLRDHTADPAETS